MSEDLGIDEARHQVGVMLERERIPQAKQILRDYLPKAPGDPLLIYYAAWIDYREGNNETALATTQQLLASHPQYESARALLFDIYMAMNRYADAEQAIIGLLQEYPQSSDYYASYSILMLSTLHLEKAGALAEEALRLDPDNPEALSASLLTRLVADQDEGARQAMRELMRRHPETEGTVRMLILMLHEQNRDTDALSLARELLAQNPSDESLVDLVVSLRVQNHWSMVPLWPMRRWGWAAAAVLWGVAVVSLALVERLPANSPWQYLVFVWLGYVVYSWVWPPVLRKLLRR